MEDTTLNKIKQQIEEIEKRIKIISTQVLVGSQLNAVKDALVELKTIFTTYQTEFDAYLQDYSSYKTTNDSDISLVKTKMANVESQMKTLETQMETLQFKFDNLSVSSGGSNGTETTNWDTFQKSYLNLYGRMRSESPTIYFSVEPTQKVKIHIECLVHSDISSSSGFSYLYVNEVNCLTTRYTYVQDGTYTIDYSFFPTKKLNTFKTVMAVGEQLTMRNFNVTIEGRNAFIFNRLQDLHILSFDNKYYITQEISDRAFTFAILDAANLSLTSSENHTIGKLNELCGSSCVYPYLVQSTTTIQKKIQNCKDYVVYHMRDGNDTASQTIMCSSFNDDLSISSWYETCIPLIGYEIFPAGFGNGLVGVALVSKKHCIYCYDLSMNATSLKYLKFNGENLSNIWYDITPVVRLDVKTGDNVYPFYGVVCLREDQTQVFYPSKDSTYCIEIAKGKNATAYIQTDGTINVYINRYKCVYKYVLQKGISGEYELKDEITTYEGITLYQELLNSKALVKKNDAYQIIDIT